LARPVQPTFVLTKLQNPFILKNAAFSFLVKINHAGPVKKRLISEKQNALRKKGLFPGVPL